MSIAVALHHISQRSSATIADGALSALTKISQVMPATLREQVSALSSVVVGVGGSPDHADAAGQVETMMTLALACSRSERTRFDYRTGDGVESMRHTEPFRLVSVGQRWYLVAFDLDRTDWRTFRVDRISRTRVTGARFQRGDVPDAAALVAKGLAVNSYDQRALVRLHAPLDVCLHDVPRTIGVASVDPDDDQCTLVEIGGDDDWVARFLLGLPMPYEVLTPRSVRDELRRIGHRLVSANPKRRRAATGGDGDGDGDPSDLAAPGSLEGQAPGVGSDQLVDGVRAP